MKRSLALLAAFVIASVHQTLFGETSGDWTYTVSDNQATITGYSGDDTEVVIPAEVDGKSVVKVEGGSWNSIFDPSSSSVTSVTIPDGVKTIGQCAFYYCTNLTSVTIPDSVTSIERFAFNSCLKLSSVNIPKGIASIGDRAFGTCYKLTSFTVDPDNLSFSSLAGVLFNKLQTELILYPIGSENSSYTIPDGVTTIGDHAFLYGRSQLISITIPDGVTTIERYAFYHVEGIINFTIPASVTTIGENNFDACINLFSITVDTNNSNYSSVDGVLFNKLQTSLIKYPTAKENDSYTISDSVTSISPSAFYGSSSLTSVTIGNSVTSIGDYAFAACRSLTSVTIPDSVTIIEWEAFVHCISLTSITIPDSVTYIEGYAFKGCTSLTSVTLPVTLFMEENYSSYSLSADQVRVEKTSIDTFVANAETAARTLGQTDVINNPTIHGLFGENTVEDVRIGLPMMRKNSEGKLLFNFQIQSSEDLENWITLDAPEYELIPSSDKEFLRVRVSNE